MIASRRSDLATFVSHGESKSAISPPAHLKCWFGIAGAIWIVARRDDQAPGGGTVNGGT